MEAVPQAETALAQRQFEAVAQCAARLRPPYYDARHKCYDKHDCGYSHYYLAVSRPPLGPSVVHQPAVQAEHGGEKGVALLPPLDFARVLVDDYRRTMRLGDAYAVCLFGVGTHRYARNTHPFWQRLRHLVGQNADRQRPASGPFNRIKAAVEQLRHLLLEHKHRPREAHQGDDYAERNRQPEMDFPEKVFHVSVVIRLCGYWVIRL